MALRLTSVFCARRAIPHNWSMPHTCRPSNRQHVIFQQFTNKCFLPVQDTYPASHSIKSLFRTPQTLKIQDIFQTVDSVSTTKVDKKEVLKTYETNMCGNYNDVHIVIAYCIRTCKHIFNNSVTSVHSPDQTVCHRFYWVNILFSFSRFSGQICLFQDT